MIRTAEQVLTAATDCVTLINDIDANGADSYYWGFSATQAEINEMVQRNVDHLELILAYTDPDVAGDSSDKSSYTDAITTGTTYISNNS